MGALGSQRAGGGRKRGIDRRVHPRRAAVGATERVIACLGQRERGATARQLLRRDPRVGIVGDIDRLERREREQQHGRDPNDPGERRGEWSGSLNAIETRAIHLAALQPYAYLNCPI